MFILGACPVLLALAMLRGVHALAPFSLIADAANILGKLNFVHFVQHFLWHKAAGCSDNVIHLAAVSLPVMTALVPT